MTLTFDFEMKIKVTFVPHGCLCGFTCQNKGWNVQKKCRTPNFKIKKSQLYKITQA